MTGPGIERCDVMIDFMDMTAGRRVWVRPVDVRSGVTVAVGGHLVVGDDDADPQVARVVAVDIDGVIELEVLPGTVESHRDLLTSA